MTYRKHPPETPIWIYVVFVLIIFAICVGLFLR